MSPEQRKARSESLLKERGIPVLDSLPCVESEEETTIRGPEEVGKRIICLFCLAGTGFDPSDRSFIDYLKKNDFWRYLTREEASYLSNPLGHKQAQINATWRTEALYFLLWAANVIPELPFPVEESKTSDFIDRLPDPEDSPWAFIHSLELRPVAEILDASDLVYRLHWAARQYSDQAIFDGGVVQEWHHAVNWLTNYDDGAE